MHRTALTPALTSPIISFTMQYEIEIKSLLPDQKAADELIERVTRKDSTIELVSEQHQLNHYFKEGDLASLIETMKDHLSTKQLDLIRDIAARAVHINVRARLRNDTVLLIVKGSLDDASAAHSHQRMEFEEPVDMPIDELDELILSSGWQLEAKWQADRKIYRALGLTIDMVKTPGYGYLVEFERVVSDDTARDEAHSQVIAVMKSLNAEELANDRLERMFAYYNEHWQEYYGTDKAFTVL